MEYDPPGVFVGVGVQVAVGVRIGTVAVGVFVRVGVIAGRTNHYGSHSKRGAEVASILHSLFESTKLAGVDPHRYVLEATRHAIASPDTATLPEDLT